MPDRQRPRKRELEPPRDGPQHPSDTIDHEPDTIQCAVCGKTTTPDCPPAACGKECRRKLEAQRDLPERPMKMPEAEAQRLEGLKDTDE